MSLRQERLAAEIRDLLAQCFQGGVMNDPRLSTVTITAVKLTADLQLASVYFRVYLDDAIDPALDGLQAATGFLKKRLAEQLTIRRVPHLRFFYDESVERGSRIESLITELKRQEG